MAWKFVIRLICRFVSIEIIAKHYSWERTISSSSSQLIITMKGYLSDMNEDGVFWISFWEGRHSRGLSESFRWALLVSLRHLEDIILNYSKIDHNLVMSDLYVTGGQNYSSCVKISSFDVMNILKKNENLLGTHFYLSLIRFVIMAYIDRSTHFKERIHYEWRSVFLCCFWWIWLQKTFRSRKSSKMTIAKQFIAEPAFFSIELNAQTLTYILLLAIDH